LLYRLSYPAQLSSLNLVNISWGMKATLLCQNLC
jgi:hypothetical protein